MEKIMSINKVKQSKVLPMKEATRLLLSHRSDSKLVDVAPKKYRGGKINKCFQNTAIFTASRKEYSVVSGWLVGDDFGSYGTVLIPHYWVYHSQSDLYFDVTPFSPIDNQKYEYVIDMEIYFQANQTSYLPPPVIVYSDGSLFTRLTESIKIQIDTIDVQQLYDLDRK
jgi:hypothetical protein